MKRKNTKINRKNQKNPLTAVRVQQPKNSLISFGHDFLVSEILVIYYMIKYNY